MSQADFEVAYDGDALRDHAMDVHQLAPALLALGDLCKEANRVLNGGRAGVSVRVVADFERKCFDIHFQLVQTLYEQVKDLVSEDHVATAKTVLEWIGLLPHSGVKALGAGGFGVTSLFAYRKLKRGRSPLGETKIFSKDGGVVYHITFQGDKNALILPSEVRDLANDPKVSRAERAVVKPLLSSGIDNLQVRQSGKAIEQIDSGEAAYFGDGHIAPTDDTTEPTKFTAILELRAPFFVPGDKWHFNFGDQKITAEITSKSFLDLVFVEGKKFGAGTKLQVVLSVTQTITESGKIKNVYEITDVLKTWEAREQPNLPLDHTDD